MAKHRPPQDPAKQVKELKKKLAKQKREVEEAKKRLLLCLKECMKNLSTRPGTTARIAISNASYLWRKCLWERSVAACW